MQHKTCCNNEKSSKNNYYVYQFIRDNGGFNNWDMIEVEKYPCNDKQELHKRERYWIELLESKLNKKIPTQSQKDRYEKNKIKILQNKKEYREKNKIKIAEKKKEYREKNKIKIAEKNKEKITCSNCNSIIRRDGLSIHQRSKKCINFII